MVPGTNYWSFTGVLLEFGVSVTGVLREFGDGGILNSKYNVTTKVSVPYSRSRIRRMLL